MAQLYAHSFRILIVAVCILSACAPVGTDDRKTVRTPRASVAQAERPAPWLPFLGAASFQPDGPQLPELVGAGNAAIPEDWYASIQADIAASEYHINWREDLGAYQSPNRAQDLRITYRPDGFRLQPRVDGEAWEVELTLDRIGKPGDWSTPSDSASLQAEGPNLVADHGDFTMDYHNGEDGMRQNFIVRERPNGEGPLEVHLAYEGNLTAADKGGNAIVFCTPAEVRQGAAPAVWYKDLHVWDANGDTLEAVSMLAGDGIVLIVKDRKAVYPVTVDPLSTAVIWSLEGNQTGARYGQSVSSTGDVNGDGYSDVIIGAPFFDNGQLDEGAVFVYHGSATGISSFSNWSAEGNQAIARFGQSVSTAGDLNGDGFSDVIIGAPFYDSGQANEGAAFVYFGSATGIVVGSSIVLESNQVNAQLGFSVNTAGDVNGDGLSDVIIGAPHFDNPTLDEGRAFVHHGGGPLGLSLLPNWTSESNTASAFLGTSVACAGDVNGDGYSDVIVGLENGGKAQVFHGSAAGLGLAAAWSFNYPTQGTGTLMTSVSSAGDVNGDGFSDVIVGCSEEYNGSGGGPGTPQGSAAVFHGGAGGLSVLPNWSRTNNNNSYGSDVSCAGDVNGDGFSEILISGLQFGTGQANEGRVELYSGGLSGLSTIASWSFETDQASATLGSAESAGDVNGDGFSDVIVGSPLYDNGHLDEGRMWMFTGSPSGLTPASSWSSEINQAGASLGFSVATAGDVNGDGFSDVIVGAPYFDSGFVDQGRAFAFQGSAAGLNVVASPALGLQYGGASALFGFSVSTAGDVNGDGYSDVIIGHPGYGGTGGAVVYHGGVFGLTTSTGGGGNLSGQAGAQRGFSVACAGDVNADGYSDVLVGEPGYDTPGGVVDAGAFFLWLGSPSGVVTGSRTVSLLSQPGIRFGHCVAGVGDVNGDGRSDYAIGAPGYTLFQVGEGRVFIYGLGSPFSQNFNGGQVGAAFGESISSAGDVNGDGFSDLIIGAPYYDNGQTDEGQAYLHLGSAAGVSVAPYRIWEINHAGAQFGKDVSSAGDVNGDGYSDVIIGAPYFDNGEADEGRAFVFHGGPTGPGFVANWTTESNQASANLGISVGCAGDVNGDGYNDVIIGASLFDNGQVDEGRALTHYGNEGTGTRHNLRLYNTDLTAPISASNIPLGQFGAGLYAKPFLGRGGARMVWETRLPGQAFSIGGGRITNSVASTAQQAANLLTATTGTEAKDLVNKLPSPGIAATRVRARLRYSMATAITGQMFGPWRYMPGFHDGHGTHNNIPLPVELLHQQATCEGKQVLLEWATGSELNNSHFVVERSEDGMEWKDVGVVPGAGTSLQLIEYRWTDDDPSNAPVAYYRLRQVDLHGQEEVFPMIPVANCGGSSAAITAYPNPTTDLLHVSINVKEAIEGGRLELRDAMGRPVSSKIVSVVAGQSTIQLDMSGLASGSYLLQLTDARGSVVDKIHVVKL